MKKNDFVTLLVTVVAVLVFGMGLCMCLIPEWNAFKPGVAVTAVGFAALLLVAVVNWLKAGRPMLHVSGRTLARIALGAAGTLCFGLGMCMVMVWQMFIPGIIAGIAGIVLLLLLIPMIAGLK